MSWEKNLEKYNKLVEQCPRFERKGKSMPYTSANGYMFSLLNKKGEFGIRFSKQKQEEYMESWNSEHLISYGAVMRGYVKVPDHMFNDLRVLAEYLNESYDYVMSLPPK